ncbi:MAG TPA: tail fiber domain-containing protein, partial [Saprospiraceae bacterium]|nr:tail fiber domain-containing protein [Saprospiraceae bacterium]
RTGLLIDGNESGEFTRLESYDYQNQSGMNLIINSTGHGNVGIGTVSAHAPLQFRNSYANRKIVLYENVNNDYQVYGLGVNDNIMRYQVPDTSSSHILYAGTSATTSAELMRIQGNGKVGIGTTTPHAPLQFNNIQGNRKIVLYEWADNDHEFYGFGINTATLRYQVPPSTNHVFFAGTSPSSSVELMRIQGDGKVGIGIPTPQFQLQLSQNSAAKPGTLFWTVASDSRLKKDIEPFTDGLDLIGKINPVWFRYNGLNGITDTARYAGIIAQEMQKVAPYMISTTKSAQRDGENYLSYDGNALLYILVNAVKEQQLQIKQQQDRIDTLEKELKAESTADVADMKAMMAQMQQELQQLKQERK